VRDRINRYFEYGNWAAVRELSALDGAQNPEALGVLAHILAAQEIWLVRLNGGDSSSIATNPDLSLVECRELAERLDKEYRKFIASLDDDRLKSTITYRNTKGQAFTTCVCDVLIHVAFHSAYHRGQIALLLRQNGAAAINTDFITFTRH
jgi:uncharacterized damage-inducible protein DinB